jgi:hypothetical protein
MQRGEPVTHGTCRCESRGNSTAIELRPPDLDLRKGSLRDAAERPVKCWDNPAMLRRERTSLVNPPTMNREMCIGPVSGGAGRACVFTHDRVAHTSR